MLHRCLASGLTLLLASCAGSAPDPEHPTASVACVGGLHCLPDSREEREQRSYRMARGWVLAEHAFLMPPPPGPQDLGDFWLALGEWLDHREDAVEAARDELEVAADEDHRQRIVAHAILGLIYEDVAREIHDIEAPAAGLEREYRDTLRQRARPFVEQAQEAYRDCAQNAFRPADMHEWSRFCELRDQDLVEDARAPVQALGAGETIVEVIVD